MRKNRMWYFSRKRYNTRIIALSIIMTLVFVILSAIIAYRSIIKGPELKAMADSQYYYEANIEDKNYRVFDCNGKDLLEYEMKYYLNIDPFFYLKFNKDKESYDIKRVKYMLEEYNKDYKLPDDIENVNLSSMITYELDETTYLKLKSIENFRNIKGVYMYSKSHVVEQGAWDVVTMLTNNINLKDSKPKPEASLEGKVYNLTENNQYAKIRYEKNLTGELKEEEVIYPENNSNLRLTLNKDIQNSINSIIGSEKYAKYNEVSVALMEADSGKIRALTQRESTNPNINLGVASNHGYFPGSIFKVIVEEAGLEQGILDLNKIYHRSPNIEEHNKKEEMTIEEAFICSSNDIFYQVGEEVGFKNFYENAKKQGLLEPVLGLYNEQGGNFEVDLNSLPRDVVRQSAIGQKIRITPLEALSIPNTVATGGIYVKPHIIEGIVDDDNSNIKRIKVEKERVLKESTADILKHQMRLVVMSKGGTGELARVDKIEVGGKTGTTEYYELDSEGNPVEYSDGWFVGFFKTKGVYYSMVVLARNIDKDYEEGGNTAAPIFKEIVENLINKDYL